MAYIVLDNIPNSCENCPMSYEAWDGATNCGLGNGNCPNWQYRPSDCKIKSIEDLITGLESHKWGKDEGSKKIYDSAINDAIVYIKEYCGVKE